MNASATQTSDLIPDTDAETEFAPPDWVASVWRRRGWFLVVLDALAVYGCFMLAYYLRFYAEFLAVKHVPVGQLGSYLNGAGLLAAVWVFFIWRCAGYETSLRGMTTPILRIRSLLMSGVYALAVLMVVSFMYRGLLLSRQVYLMTGVIAAGTMILVRLLFRAIDRDLGAQGVTVRAIAVAGMNGQAVEFIGRLQDYGGTTRIVGVLALAADERQGREAFAGHPVLGDLAGIRAAYDREPFDALVLSSPGQAEAGPGGGAAAPFDRAHGALSEVEGAECKLLDRRIIEVVNFCEEKRVVLYMVPGAFHVAVAQREVGSFAELPLFRLQDASLHPFYAVVKRILDVIGSLAGILIGLPFWTAVGVLVKLTSCGPVFFVQTRAGLHGRPFRMYKFRTMVADAEARLKDLVDIDQLDVPGFKIRNDPRVTRFGRFLRRTSLDEIPQLVNVLKGEMSLVGPRPEMPSLVDRYSPEHRRRLKAKPGLTGYQQVMARGIPLAQGVKYDLVYLKHQSFLLDAYIVLKTFVVVVRGSGITH